MYETKHVKDPTMEMGFDNLQILGKSTDLADEGSRERGRLP